MLKKVSKNDERLRRHARVRTKVSGCQTPSLHIHRQSSLQISNSFHPC